MFSSIIAWISSPYLLVAIGGGAGSALRYGVGRWVASWNSGASSMWGTGIVNLVGSFALGCIVMGFGAAQRGHLGVLLFGVGFCGGFTTFSTLAMELADLLHARRWDLAAAYGMGSIVCGWLAFVCGAWMVGMFTER
ncbi:MAG: fluoride efflux transporter FluC [Planctomycetota bacterium]|jgi:CrcB protein